MKQRKQSHRTGPFPPSKPPSVESFGTGEVAKIVGIPVWRLQKFLDSPQYQLSAEGKLGEGSGSRRIFSREDIYRIAIAKHLVQDGFAAKFAGALLEQIEDYDFHESHDQEGNELPAPGLLGLIRGEDRPKLKLFQNNHPPKLGEKYAPYYLLNLNEVYAEVQSGIEKLRKQSQEDKR